VERGVRGAHRPQPVRRRAGKVPPRGPGGQPPRSTRRPTHGTGDATERSVRRRPTGRAPWGRRRGDCGGPTPPSPRHADRSDSPTDATPPAHGADRVLEHLQQLGSDPPRTAGRDGGPGHRLPPDGATRQLGTPRADRERPRTGSRGPTGGRRCRCRGEGAADPSTRPPPRRRTDATRGRPRPHRPRPLDGGVPSHTRGAGRPRPRRLRQPHATQARSHHHATAVAGVHPRQTRPVLREPRPTGRGHPGRPPPRSDLGDQPPRRPPVRRDDARPARRV